MYFCSLHLNVPKYWRSDDLYALNFSTFWLDWLCCVTVFLLYFISLPGWQKIKILLWFYFWLTFFFIVVRLVTGLIVKHVRLFVPCCSSLSCFSTGNSLSICNLHVTTTMCIHCTCPCSYFKTSNLVDTLMFWQCIHIAPVYIGLVAFS